MLLGMKTWIALLCALTMMLTALPLLADEAPTVTSRTQWSTVKSLYGSGGGDAVFGKSSLEPQTLWIPGVPSLGPNKPSLEAIPLPDGRVVAMDALLRILHEKRPDLEIWSDENLQAIIGQDRFWGGAWKWIKDHVTFSASHFGLSIELMTGDNCVQISWSWFYSEMILVSPC